MSPGTIFELMAGSWGTLAALTDVTLKNFSQGGNGGNGSGSRLGHADCSVGNGKRHGFGRRRIGCGTRAGGHRSLHALGRDGERLRSRDGVAA